MSKHRFTSSLVVGMIFVFAIIISSSNVLASITWDSTIDPLLYYPMNDSTGATTINDYTINNLDAVSWGGAPITSITGRVGNAINLSGVRAITPSSSRGLSNWSVFTWFKTESGANLWIAFHGNDGNPQLGWAVGIYAGRIQYASNNNDNQWNSGTSLYNDNQWHHIAVTHNTSDYTNIYIDGILVNSSIYTVASLTINRYLTLCGNDIDGYMTCTAGNYIIYDEFGYTNTTVLNSTQIANLYNSGIGTTPTGVEVYIEKTNLISPVQDYNTTRIYVNFTSNATVGGGGDNELVNATLYVWYPNLTLWNETTNSVTGRLYNFTSFNISMPSSINGTFYWNVLWCSENSTSSVSCRLGNVTGNRTVNVHLAIVDSTNYNSSTYEMKYESFYSVINSSYQISAANFTWNGTTYTATVTNLGNNQWQLSKLNLRIPLLSSSILYQNITWWCQIVFPEGSWNFTVYNQSINRTHLQICNNVNATIPFINFTYKDENTLANINATIDYSTWTYWLYDYNSSFSRSFLYQVAPTENYSHGFCAWPSWETVYVNLIYKYSSTGYAQRTYTVNNLALTNQTYNKTLYLLNAGNDIIFQIISSPAGSSLSGASVIITRDIGGTNVTVCEGTTDASGTITCYLNPLYSHTIGVSYPGCTGYDGSITPTTSPYTITLPCQGNISNYYSQLEGITYQRTPGDGIVQPGVITFGYYIKSYLYPMVNVSFFIHHTNGSLVASNSTLISSGLSYCNATDCKLTVQYNMKSGDNVKGSYYVDTGNGSTLLEGDAYWRFILINQNNSVSSFSRLRIQLNDLFYNWGSDINCKVYDTEAICAGIHGDACKWVTTTNNTYWVWNSTTGNATAATMTYGLCVLRDDLNKAEFSRIVVVFFLMVIILFTIGKLTGYEMTNPGGFVIIMTICIWGLSFLGLFEYQGWTQSTILNTYGYAIICTGFCLTYLFALWRRFNA